MMTVLGVAWLLSGCGDGLEPLNGDMTIDSVLEIDPEGDISFGEVPADGSVKQTIALHAVGDTPITIQRVYFDENTPDVYSLVGLELPLGIPPNDSVNIEIRFAPDYVGTFNGHIHIYDGGRDSSRRLIGFGCDPNASGCN